ncbi:unnamed protein product, partial [Rotaria sp. Silwood2]
MMNTKEKNEDDKSFVRLNRPRILNLETQTIDVDINETTEVIDLCTCSIDVKDISIVSVVLQNASTSNATKERFRNLHRRLSILPSFPTKNNKQNYGDPLLPNIPHYQRSVMTSSTQPELYVQPTTVTGNLYFLITITNYPNLLQRTQHYQQSPNQQWQQRLRGSMLVPNIPIHVGIAHIEEHETILYNTLRFALEESIR